MEHDRANFSCKFDYLSLSNENLIANTSVESKFRWLNSKEISKYWKLRK